MIRVRAGAPSDGPDLAAVVGCAFADDPLMAWLLADVADREEATREWWAPMIAGYLAANRVLVAGDGAACLFWRHSSEQIGGAPGRPTMSEVMSRLVAPERVLDVGAALSAFAGLRPPEPHVYVHVLATRPDSQGQGLGARLLSKITALASGTPCCLESTNPRNHGFYLRYGFSAGTAVVLPGSDVVATPFVRHATIGPPAPEPA